MELGASFLSATTRKYAEEDHEKSARLLSFIVTARDGMLHLENYDSKKGKLGAQTQPLLHVEA